MSRRAREAWDLIGAEPAPAPPSAADLDALPEPVRAFAERAGALAAPPPSWVRVAMEGEIRGAPGRPPMRFTARQLIAPRRGFVWQARAHRGPAVLSGADWYYAGEAEMRFALLGIVPVLRAGGPDVARSARGRLAAESLWLPSGVLAGPGVAWEESGPRRAGLTLVVDGVAEALDVRFGPDGMPEEVRMDRWGDPDGTGTFGPVPFAGRLHGWREAGARMVPAGASAAWRPDEPGAASFFEMRVTGVTFG